MATTTTRRLPAKALSMGAAALVLGSTLATAPAITASPDSPFGMIQAAHAAEAPLSDVQVNWVIPENLRGLGTETGTFSMTGKIADSVKPGDTITFEVPSGVRIGGIQELKTPSGEVLGTLAESTGNKVTYTVTDFVNGKTGLTFKYDGAYTFNNGGKVTGDTADIKVKVNGTDYASGSTYTFDIPDVQNFSPSLYSGQTVVDNQINSAHFAGPRDIPSDENGGYTLVNNIPDGAPLTFSDTDLPSFKWGDNYKHSFYIQKMGLVKWEKTGENQWTLVSPNGETTFERDGVVMDLPIGSTYTISADGKQSILYIIDPNDATVESLTGTIYYKLDPEAMAKGFATGEQQVYPISGEATWGDTTLTSDQSRPGASKVTYNFTKGGGDGTFIAPTASLKAYAFDATGSGTTADGQNSDANDAPVYTLSDKGSIFLSAPNKDAIKVDQRIVQTDEAGNIIGEIASFTGVEPGATSTHVIDAVSLPAGGSTFYYKVLTTNPANPSLKAEASDPVKIERQVIPTAKVGVTTYINGEDANTPVTLAPGAYEVTGDISNPNTYALTSKNTTVEWVPVVDGKEQAPVSVALPGDFNIPAGGTGKAPVTQVNLAKQGEVGGFYRVAVKEAYTLATVLGGDGVATAEAQDPAYAKALTGKITTNPDKIRVKVGESFTMPILPNDATDPAGHPLDPATVKLTGFTDNGDGSLTHEASGVKVQYDGKGNLTGTAGEVEGLVKDLHYTVENTLGDVSELTLAEIDVYDYHVTLKAEIDGHDANTIEDAYKITIGHDQQTIDKRILLPFTNPGTEPITVTGFKDQAGTTYTLDEPITLAGGEAGEFYADYRFTPGTHELNFEIITEEGVTAMDPVVVVVEQEEAPAPEPTQEPKVEQEKPAEPAAPAEQPKVEQVKPAEPVVPVAETPAPEKAPVQDAPVIKGESAKTGDEAAAQGISAGVFAGLGAALLLGLTAIWAFVSRKKA